jgi:hypothetical protein
VNEWIPLQAILLGSLKRGFRLKYGFALDDLNPEERNK